MKYLIALLSLDAGRHQAAFEGERIAVVLRFQNAGEIKTELEVKALGATRAR